MEPTAIVLIVFVAVLLIAYPIMVYSRNKKENQRMQEQTNSLKRGDKVLTTSGVYGTIIDLHLERDKKIVTLETGTDKKKGYLSVDSFAIYTIFREEDEKTEVSSEDKKSKETVVEEKTETIEEKPNENESEPSVEEQPKEKSKKK